MGDESAEAERVLLFSLRGVEAYEHGSTDVSGMAVLDEPPEISVQERRSSERDRS